MSTTYPTTRQTFTNPTGTDTLTSPDHAGQHADANDTLEALQDVLGTTAGTSVLKDFAAGQFPARVNSGGTIVQTLTGGTINNTIIGTSQITGGTVNTAVLGTPTITAGVANNINLGTPTVTLGSDATGDLLYRSSGGSVTRLPIGSNGQYLTTNGTTPSWGTVSSGASTDGWTSAGETWTYASASTITVPSGAASRYQKGDRLRFKQGGSYKYYVVTTVADTLLTVMVNLDYTVANASITDNYYAHGGNPIGYPDWFSISNPVFDVSTYDNGSGAQPTSSECRAKIDGRLYTAHYRGSGVKAGTNYYAIITSHSFLARANTTDTSIIGTAFIQTTANIFAAVGSPLTAIEASVNINDNTTINHFTFMLSYEI